MPCSIIEQLTQRQLTQINLTELLIFVDGQPRYLEHNTDDHFQSCPVLIGKNILAGLLTPILKIMTSVRPSKMSIAARYNYNL